MGNQGSSANESFNSINAARIFRAGLCYGIPYHHCFFDERSLTEFYSYDVPFKEKNQNRELCYLLAGFLDQLEANKREIIENILQSETDSSSEITNRFDFYLKAVILASKRRMVSMQEVARFKNLVLKNIYGPFPEVLKNNTINIFKIMECLNDTLGYLKEKKSKDYNGFAEIVNTFGKMTPLSGITPPVKELTTNMVQALQMESICTHGITSNGLFLFILNEHGKMAIFPLLNNGILDEPIYVDISDCFKIQISRGTSIVADNEYLFLYLKSENSCLYKIPINALLTENIEQLGIKPIQFKRKPNFILSDGYSLIEVYSGFRIIISDMNTFNIIRTVDLTIDETAPYNPMIPSRILNEDHDFIPIETNGNYIGIIYIIDKVRNTAIYRVYSLFTGTHVLDEVFTYHDTIFASTLDVFNHCHWSIVLKNGKFYVQKINYLGSINSEIFQLKTQLNLPHKISKSTLFHFIVGILNNHLIHLIGTMFIHPMLLSGFGNDNQHENAVSQIITLLSQLISNQKKMKKNLGNSFLFILQVLVILLDFNLRSLVHFKTQSREMIQNIIEIIVQLPKNLSFFLFFNNLDSLINDDDLNILEVLFGIFQNINNDRKLYLYVLKQIQNSTFLSKIPVDSGFFSKSIPQDVKIQISDFDECFLSFLVMHQRALATSTYIYLKNTPFAAYEGNKKRGKNVLDRFIDYIYLITNKLDIAISSCNENYNFLQNSIILYLFNNFLKILCSFTKFYAIAQVAGPYIKIPIMKLMKYYDFLNQKNCQFYIYIFGKLSSNLIQGGKVHDFEKKFMWLLKPNVNIKNSPQAFKALSEINIENFDDPRYNQFLENENALNIIYKKYKPIFNKAAILKPEIKKMDRICLLSFSKHLMCTEELLNFDGTNPLSNELKSGCEQMMKVRDRFRAQIKDGKNTDYMIIKALMLLRMNKAEQEFDHNNLSSFITTEYVPNDFARFVFAQKSRIQTSISVFDSIDEIMEANKSISPELCIGEIISYTLSKIKSFDGLSSVLQMSALNESQEKRVSDFFIHIGNILASYPNNGVAFMSYVFFRDITMLKRIQNTFIESIYKIILFNKENQNNYSLFVLAISLSNNLDFIFEPLFRCNFKNYLHWIHISEALKRVEPPQDFILRISSFDINNQNAHFVLNAIYYCLPYIKENKIYNIFDDFLEEATRKVIKNVDSIIASEIIQFFRRILSSNSHEKEVLEKYILTTNLEKAPFWKKFGILSIFGLCLESERPYTLIKKHLNRKTVEEFYSIPNKNESGLIYYSYPFNIKFHYIEIKADKLGYSIPLYQIRFEHYDYIIKYFNYFTDSNNKLPSILSSMYMQAFAFFTQFPKFVSMVSEEHIRYLTQNLTQFSDLFETVKLIKKYSVSAIVSNNDLEMITHDSIKYDCYLTKQINLNKNQFDIAINIKKPRLHPNIIFGIVSDYLNQYESRYKVVYYPSGYIYPYFNSKIDFPGEQKHIKITVDNIKKTFTVNGKVIPFPNGDCFKFIIAVPKDLKKKYYEIVIDKDSFADNSPSSNNKFEFENLINILNTESSNKTNLVPYESLSENNQSIKGIPLEEKYNKMFIIPIENILIHPGFSDKNTLDISAKMIDGLYHKLEMQWKSISVMRIARYNSSLIKPIIFKLFKIIIDQLEVFLPSLLCRNQFPFSLENPIWGDTDKFNRLYDGLEYEMRETLNTIISEQENIKLICDEVYKMSNSKDLHLMTFQNKYHHFTPMHLLQYEINISTKQFGILAFNDFSGYNDIKLKFGSNVYDCKLPYLLQKQFNGNIRIQFLKKKDFSAFIFGESNNDWLFNTPFELLLLLKNLSFLTLKLNEKIKIKMSLFNCFILQSPFIIPFLPEFLDFIQMRLPTSPFDRSNNYFYALSVIGGIGKHQNYNQLILFYHNEYDILIQKDAVLFAPFFPEFFYSVPNIEILQPFQIPVVCVDPGLIENADYEKQLRFIQKFNRSYSSIKSFPFWSILPYWYRISEFWTGDNDFVKPTAEKVRDIYVIRNPNAVKIRVQLKITDRNEVPLDLIAFVDQSESFENGNILTYDNMFNPILIDEGTTYIALIGSTRNPWNGICLKLIYQDQSSSKNKAPKRVDPSVIHDAFINDMEQFACKWTDENTEDLLVLFNRSQLTSPTFSDIKSIAKSSSLCSQFSSNVVILKALLIHHFNFMCSRGASQSFPMLVHSLNRLTSIDDAINEISSSIETSESYPTIIFDRHSAQRLIFNGKGDFRQSMISQFSVIVSDLGAIAFRSKLPWKIKFQGELAIDAGGPSREALTEIASSIFEPTSDLMYNIPGSNSFVPKSSAYSRGNDFYAIGVYLGMTVRMGFSQNLPFSKFIWKFLAREKINEKDITVDDPALADNFKNARSTGSAKWITTTWENISVLMPGHKKLEVAKDEIEYYISEVIKDRIDRIKPVLKQIRKGFNDNIGFKHHRSLTSYILSRIALGNTNIPVGFLKSITQIIDFKDGHNNISIKLFWKVVGRFDQEQLKLLLKFWTTLTRLPNLTIFPNFKLSIDNLHCGSNANNSFPTASTCFNKLHLPEYTDEEKAYEKILYAITNCQTMELK